MLKIRIRKNILICENIKMHGSGSEGQNINRKHQKKNMVIKFQHENNEQKLFVSSSSVKKNQYIFKKKVHVLGLDPDLYPVFSADSGSRSTSKLNGFYALKKNITFRLNPRLKLMIRRLSRSSPMFGNLVLIIAARAAYTCVNVGDAV